MDPYAGSPQDPQLLHKYLYCHANPVNATEPTGNMAFSIAGLSTAISIGVLTFTIVSAINHKCIPEAAWLHEKYDFLGNGRYCARVGSILDAGPGGGAFVEGVLYVFHFCDEVCQLDKLIGGVSACEDDFDAWVSGIDELFNIFEFCKTFG